jgi:deazaflavin-dependent oxidoreductase (nitroreductase family)
MTPTVPHADHDGDERHAPKAGVRAPLFVRGSNPLTRRLLRAGMPIGPTTLLTVRGRTTGEPRSAPVAILNDHGRRYVIGAYGDVQWVRNLRAAGEGTIREHGREVAVMARELDRAEAVEFFGVTLRGYVAQLPLFGRAFARFLFVLVGREVLDDPELAASTRPVFELTLADRARTHRD